MSEIQFAQILTDSRGENLMEKPDVPLTLARACDIALDAPHQSDSHDLKPKLRRARLIEDINNAARNAKPLALEAGDIELIKERVAKIFNMPSVVRKICLALDPATKE